MWHNQGVESSVRERSRGRRRERPPLNAAQLNEIALTYVSRFATTRAKLSDYLQRKLRERGWSGERTPDVEGLAARMAELGYVDDAAFAVAKSRSLTARGYGRRRLDQALRSAGVGDSDAEEARTHAAESAAEAALGFARRRRLGPFASASPDAKGREKALAAMVRAGHDFALARAVIDAAPGAELSAEQLINHC